MSFCVGIAGAAASIQVNARFRIMTLRKVKQEI